MNITNKHNIPAPIVYAANADSYSRGDSDISVTELIDAPRIRLMNKRFAGQVTEDANDKVYALLGSMFHQLMAQSAEFEGGVIVEERIHMTISGVKLSGAVDRQIINNGGIIIEDFKVTSVSAYQLKSGLIAAKSPSLMKDHDWVQQTNCYAYLAAKAKGIPVTGINVIVMLRDWSKVRADNDKSYPQSCVIVVPIKLYTPQQQYSYILKRIKLHRDAETKEAMTGEMPMCGEAEYWGKPDGWAILPATGGKARKVFPNFDAANNFVDDNIFKTSHRIELRPGDRVRCEHYCPHKKHCDQYNEHLDQVKTTNEALKIVKKQFGDNQDGNPSVPF